jgi:hypothetical protein
VIDPPPRQFPDHNDMFASDLGAFTKGVANEINAYLRTRHYSLAPL